jgi:hypothetical protein
MQEIDFTFNGTAIKAKVEPNEYYETKESMFKVHVGLHDDSRSEESKKEIEVEKIIMVCLYDLI